MVKTALVALMIMFIMAGCGGGKSSSPATLVAIAVTPVSRSIAPGTSTQFSAQGIYSDNSVQILTSSVTWSSVNSDVATVSDSPGSKGLATAVTTGSAAITAAFGGISGSATLTSSALVSIEVAPANPVAILGAVQQFRASGVLANSDRQSLTGLAIWNSSNPAVATISAGGGLASAVSAGSTTISAAFAGFSATTGLTVQSPSAIAVTPAAPSAVAGSTLQFTATGTFADGSVHDVTTLAAWSSSSGGVASISNSPGSRGIATAVATGSTTVSATLGVSGSSVLAVKTLIAIVVEPLNPTMVTGSILQLTARGTFSDKSTQDITASVSWASQNPGIAVISNVSSSKGVVTANVLGSTIITANFGDFSASTALNVIQGNRAYVVNSGSSNLSVIDTASNTLVSTVAVGSSPQSVAVNTATNRAYVTNSGSSSLSIIDTAGNTLVATISVGSSPQSVAVNAATNRAYVTNSGSSSISVIDTVSNSLVATVAVGSSPRGVAVNAATGRAYVVNSGSSSLSVIDTANNSLVATVPVGVAPQRIALNTASNRAYVTNSGSNSLSVIDMTDNTLVATLSVGSAPQGVAVNVASNRAYVTNSGSNSLSVIDTAGNSLVATVAVGSAPQGVALNPATSRAYVANSGSSSLSVIDTTVNAAVATITVGSVPKDVALTP